jgi:iron-sulfur cluster assembly protein
MINLTNTAIQEVKRLRDQQGHQDAALRLGVTGGGCSGLQYAMQFDRHVTEADQTFEYDGLRVVCDPRAYLYLSGVTIDFSQEIVGGGFKFENPNAQRSCGCGTSFSA